MANSFNTSKSKRPNGFRFTRRAQSRKSRIRETLLCGSAAEILEQRMLLTAVAFDADYDFGVTGSPVATGFTEVRSDTTYSSGAGYGWQSGTINSRDRGASFGDDLSRDFNFTTQGTFAVDVPVSGTYDVTLVMGDGQGFIRDDMGIFLEGTLVDSVTASGGNFAVNTYRVHVTDGQLNVMFQDQGGVDPLVMINGLSVTLVAADQQDTTGPNVIAVEPGGPDAGTLDRFVVTFNEDIDPASFTVDDVNLNGPNGAIAAVAVNVVNGNTFEVVFAPQTALGAYSISIGPDVSDVAGNLLDQDGDGVLGEAGDDVFSGSINLEDRPVFEAHFDFGTDSSPVTSGYTGVSFDTLYSAGTGFGWESGVIGERDRGVTTGSDLERDFNFTTQGTFSVDVSENGFYRVTLVMGDGQGFTRDEMGIFFEGVLVDTVTSLNGEFVVNTYLVEVTDGQLTINFEDFGGIDSIVVVNGLDVVSVATTGDDSNPPPEADAGGGYAVNEGGTVQLNGSVVGDTSVTYTWDLDGDGVFGETGFDARFGDEVGMNPVFNAEAIDGATSVNVTLRVTDEQGRVSEDTANVEVQNVAPEVTDLHLKSRSSRRGGVVRVFGKFKDAGISDTHVVTVDWGDGTESQLRIKDRHGFGRFSGRHRYRSGGTFEVKVTVTDDEGASTTTIESVTVAGISLKDGTLRIVGTDGNDRVTVRRVGRHYYMIKARFLPCGHQFVRVRDVERIEFEMRGGNDRVKVAGNVRVDVSFDGGEGRDVLVHGGRRWVGNDLVFANVGTNTGSSFQDLLFGFRSLRRRWR